jgi:hypothetical protein
MSPMFGMRRERKSGMKPRDMRAVIGRKVYDTATATLIADNAYWDGHNFERHGRNTFLYRAKNGGYFAVYLTCWQGEQESPPVHFGRRYAKTRRTISDRSQEGARQEADVLRTFPR